MPPLCKGMTQRVVAQLKSIDAILFCWPSTLLAASVIQRSSLPAAPFPHHPHVLPFSASLLFTRPFPLCVVDECINKLRAIPLYYTMERREGKA